MNRQYCPICSQEVEANIRYPSYVCNNCLAQGLEVGGQQVSVTELDVYRNSKIACTVKGIDCVAIEARFGGVVVQPILL